MTRDELNRKRMMFQIYANRNKMPQVQKNDNEEPIAHSATNDFLEYRKKVAAGVRMQKENNKSNLFNITAANEQYRQDLMDQNIIIHAGTGEFKPTYYQKVENAFGPGKHRYFYTKEEWDAYQNELAGYRKKADDYVKNRDANTNAGANRGTKDSTVANAQKYKKESEQNVQRRESLQNAQSSREAAMRSGQQATQKMTEQRQQTLNNAQSGRESAIKNSESMVTPKKGAKDAVKDLADKTKAKVKDAVYKEAAKAEVESIRSDTARWNKYDVNVRDQVQSKYSDLDTFDKFLERAEKEGGIDKFYDKLEKEMRTLQNNVDSSNKPGADRAAKEAPANNKKSSENKSSGDTAEERHKKILDDAFKEGANADDLASKYGMSTDYVRELVYNVTGKTIPTKKEIEAKNSGNSGSNKTGNVSKEYQHEMESNSKKNTYELKSGPKNGSSNSSNSSGYYFTVENGKTVRKAKHSSLEDGITTSDDISPDQEYLNFRARVEAGMKHFGMTRGLMSVPVNQALKNGESLSHAGTYNYKYYQKIDLGDGNVRYFYTKEEWDAFNNDFKKNAKEGQAYQKWRLDKGYPYDDENTATGIAARKAKMKNEEKNGASYLTKKEGFVAKSLTPTAKAIGNKIADDISNGKNIPESQKNAIKTFAKSTEKAWQKKFEERDYNTRHDLPENYPFKNKFKELDDDIWDAVGKDTDKKLINSYLKDGGIKEAGEILKDFKDDVFSQTEEELSKREKSIESFNNMKKSFNKIKTIEDDTESLSNFEKQLLADELGISEWSEEAIAKKYGIDENSAKEPGDDYGASNFDKLAEAYDAFWNDYKAAKKAINSSTSKAKEED